MILDRLTVGIRVEVPVQKGVTFGEIFQTFSTSMVVYVSVVTFLCSVYFFIPSYYGGFLDLLRDH